MKKLLVKVEGKCSIKEFDTEDCNGKVIAYPRIEIDGDVACLYGCEKHSDIVFAMANAIQTNYTLSKLAGKEFVQFIEP